MRPRPIAIALVLSAFGAFAKTSAADDASHARAAESFREGQAAFERHEFTSAAAAFELAASFEPNAVSFLDAADAWMRAGEPVRAAEDGDRALGVPNVTADERTYASRILANVADRIATIDFEGAATTTMRVDAGEELRAPVRKRVSLGEHRVVVTNFATGKSETRNILFHRGDEITVRAPLEEKKSEAPSPIVPEPPSPTHAGFHLPTATWISFGVGVAAAGVATVFGVVTLTDKNNFDSTPTIATRDSFYRDRDITNIAWVTAAVGIAAGAVVWIAVGRDEALSRTALGIQHLRIDF